MRHRSTNTCLTLTALILALAQSGARADEDLQLPDAEFQIARDGDIPVVAVDVAGKEFQFVVSTGATVTVFHVRHRPLLRRRRSVVRGVAPSGKTQDFEVFDAPVLRVGNLTPQLERVTLLDFGVNEERSGHRIDGCLGMDVLKRFAVRFDFDRGTLQLFRSVPADSGEGFPLRRDAFGIPTVHLAVGGERASAFTINTAITAPVILGAASLAMLRRSGSVQMLDRTLGDDAPDRREQSIGFVDRTELEGFTHRQVRIEPGSGNQLGLGYLSRYVVTLDFPQGKLFLKKGAAYDRADGVDCSGLKVDRRNGRSVVGCVWAGSPASENGVLEEDEIVQVNGEPVEKHSIFQLRRIFEKEHGVACLRVARVNRAINFELPLRDYRNSEKEAARHLIARIEAAGRPANGAPILAEFDVEPRGAPLVLPLHLEGIERPLNVLVDTGTSSSLWDQRIRRQFGPALGSYELDNPELPSLGVLVRVPAATLGGIKLAAESTGAVVDLDSFIEGSGFDLDGVMGIHFLRSQIVQVDFDAGKFRLLSVLPEKPGERYSIEYRPSGTPAVAANAGSLDSEWFMIDTGCTIGTEVSERVFSQLKSRGELCRIEPGRLGNAPITAGRLQTLSLGPFAHRAVQVMSRKGSVSLLGLEHLSRYIATFDFPGRAMYLKKGMFYDKSERIDASGVWISKRDGAYVVDDVSHGGPAENVGIKIGDVILSVDGRDAIGYSLFQLRQLLKDAGNTISVGVRRGERQFEAKLALRDFFDERMKRANERITLQDANDK